MVIWQCYADVCFWGTSGKCGLEVNCLTCRCAKHVNISDWQLLNMDKVSFDSNAGFYNSLEYICFLCTEERCKPLSHLHHCRTPCWVNKCCGSNPAEALLNLLSIKGETHFSVVSFAQIICERVFNRGISCFISTCLLKNHTH